MAKNHNNNKTDIVPVDLAEIARGQQYEYVTEANLIVRVALDKLRGLVNVSPGYREPNPVELTEWAGLLIEHQLNPYTGDCWLIPFRLSKDGPVKWTPVIAEKVRLLRASSRTDCEGFEQGWITSDGVRHKQGVECTAKQEEITGIWGRFHRKGRKPYTHETFCNEYAGGKMSQTRKLTHIQKVNRDQGFRLAFPEICTNLYTENEMAVESAPAKSLTPEVAPRAERKQLESAVISDSAEVLQEQIKTTFEKFKGALNSPIYLDGKLDAVPEEAVWQVFAKFREIIIPNTGDVDYTDAKTYTLVILSQMQAYIEHEGIPDRIVELVPVPMTEEEVNENLDTMFLEDAQQAEEPQKTKKAKVKK